MSPGSTAVSPLADQAARDLAVSEFVVPVALEAGAGTGKTRSLVARLATWLLGPGWAAAAVELEERRRSSGVSANVSVEPEEIAARVAEGTVAITFTDAAAAEMSRRLGELLGDLSSGTPAKDLAPLPPLLAEVDLVERAQRLASVLSRLRLQTIHSFCHRLLADHPFEAGLHPVLSVDADGTQVAQAATEVLLERLRTRQPQIAALIAEGVDPAALHAGLVKLLGSGARKEDFSSARFDDATCAAILESVAEPLGRFLSELARLAATASRVTTLPPALEALLVLERLLSGGRRDRAALEALCDAARSSSPPWEKLFARYAKEGVGKTEAGILGAGSAGYLASANAVGERLGEILALDPQKFELARQALGPLVEAVRVRLQRAGVLSFEDLLDRATELVQRSGPVRRRLRREIRQLLVDEFQDTDRRQCELLAALALGHDEGPRPGLFVVGDPKQSIYAWRNADLASYERFLARMQEAGGKSARLSVNFRSVPAVLAEVERAIAPVMQHRPGVQPRFESLTPSPKLAASPGFIRRDRHPVEHWLSWDSTARRQGEKTTAAQACLVEAAAIAADIRELHDANDAGDAGDAGSSDRSEGARGLSWGSFGILLRARGDLEVYLEALRRAGIPYAVQKDRSYYRRREIIDLACAVRAILDPSDLLALVAFLRSPLVGVPDAAWIPLWRAGFAVAMSALEHPQGTSLDAVERAIATAARETPREIPGLAALGDWPLALREAVGAVARLRADFSRLPAQGWVERLRALLLPEPLAAARFLGRFGVANVERLLATLERDLAEESDPHRALVRLRKAVEEERDAEDARPPDAGSDAVAVMTIHTAKGLEFDQVYLAQAHKRRPAAGSGIPSGLTDIAGLAPETPEARVGEQRELVLFGAPSPGYAAAESLRRQARDAEAVRLLYVALTRAKERLVVCANWPENEKPTDLAVANSFLDLLAERRPPALHELAGESEIRDAMGVPWRLAASPPRAAAPDAEARLPAAARRANPSSWVDLLPGPVTPALREAARRRAGRLRLERAFGLAVAGEDPHAADAASPAADGGVSRSLRRALGVALHRAFELEELAESDRVEWRRAVDSAFLGELPAASAGDRRTLAIAVERWDASALLARLRTLRGSVQARELPLLIETSEASGTSGVSALDGIVGTLDLLYRDPVTGETVIADFKTDEIPPEESSAAIASKGARYRPQLELYGRAVQSAMGLDRPPRLELWLLAVDAIFVLD